MGPPAADHAGIQKLYQLGPVVGTGGFSEVVHAVDRQTKQAVAIKILEVSPPNSALSTEDEQAHFDRVLQAVRQEISIHQHLRHKNVLQLRDVFRQGRFFYLVTDLCTGGDLLSEVLAKGYSEDEARLVIHGVCRGLHYLHSEGIVHRDIKLENLLLVRRGDRTSVRIADFGLAVRTFSREHLGAREMSGSLLYIAPEVIRCAEAATAAPRDCSISRRLSGDGFAGAEPPRHLYDERVDLWSLGVTLYILLFRQAPFASGGGGGDSPEPAGGDASHEESDIDQVLRRIKDGRFSFPPAGRGGRRVSPEAKDLISRLLVTDPAKRISLPGVMRHPWMAKDRVPAPSRGWRAHSQGPFRPPASAETRPGPAAAASARKPRMSDLTGGGGGDDPLGTWPPLPPLQMGTAAAPGASPRESLAPSAPVDPVGRKKAQDSATSMPSVGSRGGDSGESCDSGGTPSPRPSPTTPLAAAPAVPMTSAASEADLAALAEEDDAYATTSRALAALDMAPTPRPAQSTGGGDDEPDCVEDSAGMGGRSMPGLRPRRSREMNARVEGWPQFPNLHRPHQDRPGGSIVIETGDERGPAREPIVPRTPRTPAAAKAGAAFDEAFDSWSPSPEPRPRTVSEDLGCKPAGEGDRAGAQASPAEARDDDGDAGTAAKAPDPRERGHGKATWRGQLRARLGKVSSLFRKAAA